MKLFSNNIIFLDTEFSSLDPYKGEILSIGLVKTNGEELYLELEYEGEVDEWVKVNIIPTLKEQKVKRGEAIKIIKDFIGDTKPYMVGYVNHFDSIYWHKLYKSAGFKDNPFYWIPIDFASMLFALGINPEIMSQNYYSEDKINFYKKIEVDITKYKQHHALDDAKLLREVYLKLVKTKFDI